MHKLTHIATTATALVILSWAPSSVAQSNCGNIQFSSDISSRFPNASAACVGIVERDGRPYAHFRAEIVRVRGSTVEARFTAPDGRTSRTIEFTPPSDARVRIQGRSYRYSELSPGQELDVYLPPDRWEIAVAREPVDFAAAQSVERVPLREPSPQLAALPATAGSLPWLAVIGTLLAGLGAGLAAIKALRRA